MTFIERSLIWFTDTHTRVLFMSNINTLKTSKRLPRHSNGNYSHKRRGKTLKLMKNIMFCVDVGVAVVSVKMATSHPKKKCIFKSTSPDAWEVRISDHVTHHMTLWCMIADAAIIVLIDPKIAPSGHRHSGWVDWNFSTLRSYHRRGRRR